MSSHFIDRQERGERALLVCVSLGQFKTDYQAEFTELATSANVEVLAVMSAWRQTPHAKYLLGSGKVEEIAQQVQLLEADVVLVDAHLSPAQERNIEKAVKCRVIDRSGLILDIFAQRARSFEGKLQVELAQLRHISARLVKGWTHLERQKGGIGLRGPGETQLETDRRLLAVRIKQLSAKLDKVDQQRELSRRARAQNEVPTVSLVGYTNAGKSTLFNQLSDAGVHAADQLFATLDPTLRRIELAGNCPIVLADTVGFIRDLPHELISAFRATLQESAEADLLLHVIDVSDADKQTKIDNVNSVLENINAHTIPQIHIYNKCDAAGMEPRIQRDDNNQIAAVYISALNRDGFELLEEAIREFVQNQYIEGRVLLSAQQQKLRADLHQNASILDETFDEQGNMLLLLRVSKIIAAKYQLKIEPTELLQQANQYSAQA